VHGDRVKSKMRSSRRKELQELQKFKEFRSSSRWSKVEPSRRD